MVEAGGIGKGGRATAGEDMDCAMVDCGGRGKKWADLPQHHLRPLPSPAVPPLPPPPPAFGWTPLRCMVEAGGIGKGGRATAGEDMDGAMADCGGRGTGGGAAAEAVAAAHDECHHQKELTCGEEM
jgi:hypothetical protein